MMTILEIEKRIICQLHELPIESAEEVLDFTVSLRQRLQEKSRPPGERITGQKRYTMVELGGTEPDLMVPPRRREESPL
uniref:DUF2281 domain-containing protein n=1 Tax=Candidatus Kentrum sp. FM TaxID=2126340 RepID=A0A450T761_9GAMM|nr:MAG: hypothetical protein BECKFM1743C_GA0114222_102683 [Candidatus Kentron sp. FM]VFJ62372.1 MAG: hypothetical protein BECKFM1743A_GA0114220_103055 [Candidatus Kentron sp. FM]VFK13917.1 MAG: hypothetical protein BECKFM1743B_GA0114221_102992 [Candidatus Kentron sp. FM]